MRKENHHSNNNSKADNDRVFIGNMNMERQFLRSILLYGCYNRQEYLNKPGVIRFPSSSGEKNMAKGTLDNENRRLRAFLPEGVITKDRNNNYVCSYDLAYGKDHLLLFAYCLCSCSPEYTSVYIRMQAYLGKKGSKSVGEIKEHISDVMMDENIEKNYHRKAMKNDLKKLENAGLIEKKDDRYQETEDLLENYSNQALTKLLRLLDFEVNTSPFPAPYYMAWRKIRLYLLSCNGMDLKWFGEQELQNFRIVYPRKHAFSQLDQEQIYQLLRAIHDQCEVKLELFERDRDNPEKATTVTEKTVLPVRIREDMWSGRMMVICMENSSRKLHQYRIDYINRVEILGRAKQDLAGEAKEKYETFRNYIWSTSENVSEQWTEVRVKFHVTDDTEYVLRRVEKEALNYEEDEKHPGEHIFVFKATDPNDMTEWLRSFGEAAEVLEPESLRHKIQKQWQSAEAQMNAEKIEADTECRDFIGNQFQTKTENQKKKESDITLTHAYENIRNEIMTALWNYVWNHNGKITDDDIENICTCLLPEDSGLKDNLDLKSLFGEIRNRNDKAVGKLFVRDDSPDVWKLNLDDEDYEGVPVRLTEMEKEAVASLAQKRDQYEKFLGKGLCNSIAEFVPEENMTWNIQDIDRFNNWESLTSDQPDPAQIQKLLRIMKQRKAITFQYEPYSKTQYDGDRRELGYPLRLEYFPDGNRIRVVMYMAGGRYTCMMAGRMKNIEIASKAKSENIDALYQKYLESDKRELIMEIKPVSYALERIVRLFSYYKKTMTCDEKSSVYTMRLEYMSYDEQTLIRDILSCGDFVRVVGNPDLREKIRKRIHQATVNYQ